MDPINIAISKEHEQSIIEYNFIIWADKSVSKIIGVTFDKLKGKKVKNRALLVYLVQKITSNGIPLLLIEHDFPKNDISVIDANINRSHKYSSNTDELEKLILNNFSIGRANKSTTNIKAVNVNSRVYDGFHTWSREVFGSKIKKVDIDCLLFKNHVVTTIEVKNTSRSGMTVEQWQPFISDSDNYKIVGLFSERVLDCDFITLHHNIAMNRELLSNEIHVGLWKYHSSQTFNQFRSDINRLKINFNEVIKQYLT